MSIVRVMQCQFCYYVQVGSDMAVCEEDFRELREEAEGVRL